MFLAYHGPRSGTQRKTTAICIGTTGLSGEGAPARRPSRGTPGLAPPTWQGERVRGSADSPRPPPTYDNWPMSERKLRSQEWWSQPNYESFVRRAWLRAEGFTSEVFQNKPVIGICNSWSELNDCNAHLRTVAEAVKRGVWAAGGFPLEFPTISLGEVFMRPTTMLYRNLMAMDVEESIRANPIDGVVLLCGCDKTTPAQLMGAASADIPAIMVPGGPMLSGQWKDRRLGSGTDGRKLFDLFAPGSNRESHGPRFHGVHHDDVLHVFRSFSFSRCFLRFPR